MSINSHKIKKWTNMLLGKSVYHVNQKEGTIYSKTEIRGYYNDLTEKVSRFGRDDNRVPTTIVDNGEEVYFSIAIFQYGLGAYDLYLKSGDNNMLEKAISCADWAVENQQKDGGWCTFAFENSKNPYSSMAQGEGISLLLRAHISTGEYKYLKAADLAKDFMLLPVDLGGTTRYVGEDIYLYEYTHEPLILNGWIFSIWGLYDYCCYTKDSETQKILNSTLISLEKKLKDFDIKYWSKYDDGKRICSPFYHKLHIAQLKVMYDLTGEDVYNIYAEKWEKYEKNNLNYSRAFLKKALQKVFSKD